MFYVKLLGHVVAMCVVLIVLGLARPGPYVAATVGLALVAWVLWLLARLVGHLTRRRRAA